jgi:hypothetical protein
MVYTEYLELTHAFRLFSLYEIQVLMAMNMKIIVGLLDTAYGQECKLRYVARNEMARTSSWRSDRIQLLIKDSLSNPDSIAPNRCTIAKNELERMLIDAFMA